jgi:DNA-binding NtrC family response regulator
VLDASSGDPHKGSTGDDYQSAVRDFKRQLVETTLARTDGNQTEAAQLLGLHRTYLSKLMKDLGLR